MDKLTAARELQRLAAQLVDVAAAIDRLGLDQTVAWVAERVRSDTMDSASMLDRAGARLERRALEQRVHAT